MSVGSIGGSHIEFHLPLGSNHYVPAPTSVERGRLAVVGDFEMRSHSAVSAAYNQSDRINRDISPQLGARHLSLLPEGKRNQRRSDEAKQDGQEGIIRRIAGSISRFPLSAQIAASLVLAIFATRILFSGYVVDGIDNPRRARVKLGVGLGLLLLSGWLWLGGG
ncbi:MAG: hypothetical protein ABIW58_09045 [Sphingomicrobium sp.]